MKHKVFIAVGIMMMAGLLPAWSQPASRNAKQAETKSTGNELSVRAQTRFPGNTEAPKDVAWTREIYRTLD